MSVQSPRSEAGDDERVWQEELDVIVPVYGAEDVPIGAVFLVICGMIATVGLRLITCAAKDEAWLLTTAIALIAALTLPSVTAAQTEWFAGLPPLARLFLGNPVVIAITLGIVLNAVFRAALPSAERT